LHLFILVIYSILLFSARDWAIFWILDFLEFLDQVHPDETF